MFDTRTGTDELQTCGWGDGIDSPSATIVESRTALASAANPPARLFHSSATPVVFVVDSDESVRQSLELLIRCAGRHAESFTCAREFLARPRVVAPSCLVLDLTLPGLDGLDLQARIVDRTDLPIIFISGCADVPTTVQAMKAGAFEFFAKPVADDVLLGAIERAIERSGSALREEAEVRALRDRQASLSRRECEVMTLVVAGLLNKQVAGELGISEITVKIHRANVMRKMDADSFAGLVTMAAELGLAPAARRHRRHVRPHYGLASVVGG